MHLHACLCICICVCVHVTWMCVCVHNTIHTAHVRDGQCFPHYCGNTQPWISSLINLGDTMCPHTGVQKAPVAYPCLVYYNTTMKANKVSMYVCLYHHVNSTNHSLSYSGKLSGEKTFVNLVVLWLFVKVFSAKFGGVMSFGRQKWENFIHENCIFHQFAKVRPSNISC